MAEKKKFIEISPELQCVIAKKFGVSTRTVRYAMNYEKDSPTSKAIRAYALNKGGTLFEEAENPYAKVKSLN